MRNKDNRPAQAAPATPSAGQALRQRAEEIARETAAQSPENIEAMSPDETRRLLHELRVHQVELELQNEELRRAQLELDAARLCYFDLYDLAPVGYVTLSEQGLLLEANVTAATLLGIVRGALVKQQLSCFILPEDQDIYYLHRKQLFATGEPQTCKLRMVKKDGTPFWAHLAASAAQDAAGAPVSRVVLTDVTAQEQTETTLREIEERHPTILQTAMDGFWLVDMQGRLMEVNETYCRMSGYGKQELLAMSIPDLEAAETFVDTTAHLQTIMAQGETRFESRHRRKDGSTFDVEVSVQYRPIDGGRFVAFLRDITERKKTEEKLLEFKTAVEQSVDGIALADLDGHIRFVNEAWARLHGYSSVDELVGQHLGIFHTTEQLEAEVIPFNEQVLETGSYEGEVGHVRKDGMTFQTWMTSTVLTDADRHPFELLGIARDITERKRAEEELRAANAQLEQAVARAEELAVRAEAANRAKSEFLANMSHEIRTPMTAILGCSELLNTGDLSPTEQRTFLQSIQSCGEGLLGIINDILDLSRIEADRLPLEKTDYPLQQILDEVMAVARIAAAKKGLSLQVAYSLPVPATIYTDPARLRQILVNLVGNAVKFTEHGEVSVTVRCCESDEGTARVQFVVSDMGIGIPSAMLDEIFQPFVQVDGSHTRRYGGTGLGLSICQRLAQALDGRIEVTSELGRGSTFTLTIDGGPWRTTQGRGASPDQATGPTTRAEQGGEPSPVLQGRVLLVEDEPSLQVVIRHLLRKLKLEVELAGDGHLACQLAEQSRSEGRPYALILMDIQLPQMDGLAATRWLRTQGWPGPIVALTAYAMVGDRERCLAAGCDDYLSKPISPSGLREVLRRYLGQGVNA